MDAHLPRIVGCAARRGGDDRQLCSEGATSLGRRKRGAAAQAIGRSRGGRTTKIHAVCDGIGRLCAFQLSPGNIADITVAPALLDIAPVGQTFLADKGYDATPFRNRVATRGARVVIPNNATRKRPYPFDATAYQARNVIERMFCRLKDYRRIATRYDRLARNFASAVALAATITWST
jgi:transposase